LERSCFGRIAIERIVVGHPCGMRANLLAGIRSARRSESATQPQDSPVVLCSSLRIPTQRAENSNAELRRILDKHALRSATTGQRRQGHVQCEFAASGRRLSCGNVGKRGNELPGSRGDSRSGRPTGEPQTLIDTGCICQHHFVGGGG
jgi:hypothetical protein